MYSWLLFAHIASVAGVLLAHGTSVAMAFRLRSETTTDGIRSLTDLSKRTTNVMTDALLKVENYIYDGDGNLTQATDRKGQVAVATYDNQNRLNFVGFGKTVSNKGVVSYQSSISYTYDAGDRPIKVVDSASGTITPVFDVRDRLTSETTAQGQITYTYDAANRRTTQQVVGQPQVGYAYYDTNQLKSITQGTAVATPAYDNAGRMTNLTLPNGVSMTYGYDLASRLTSITYTKGSTNLGDVSYSYDAAGQRIGVTGAFARTNFPAALTSATYNADNELTKWGSISLTYDANGNILSDGTNTYSWDARNQLSTLTKSRTTNSFQYDAYGRRIQKTVGGVATSFLYDGANPVEELSGTNAISQLADRLRRRPILEPN
jgi:YD repeat-containing protein